MTNSFKKVISSAIMIMTLTISGAAYAGPALEVGTKPFNGQTVSSCMSRVQSILGAWQSARLTYSTDSIFASGPGYSVIIVCNGWSQQAEIAASSTDSAINLSQLVFNLRSALW